MKGLKFTILVLALFTVLALSYVYVELRAGVEMFNGISPEEKQKINNLFN